MQRLGKYVDLELVGQGASAKVYKAYHPELGVQRALKVFEASDQGREERIKEAVSQAGLDHPGIVKVLDCGRENGIFYLVMEYAPDGTLRQRLANGPFAVSRALNLAAQIASALTGAHSRGIQHLDLKPENILFFGPDRVKIADFGLARSFDEENPITVAAGTPNYMAPEQLYGQPHAASDQWGLGCLLFEMLTGQVCFAGESLQSIQAAVKRGPGDLARRLTKAKVKLRPGMVNLVQRLLNPMPLQRFDSAREALDSIEELMESGAKTTVRTEIPASVSAEAEIEVAIAIEGPAVLAPQPEHKPEPGGIPTQIVSNHCIKCGVQIPLDKEYCPKCSPQTRPLSDNPNVDEYEPLTPSQIKPSLVRPRPGLSRIAVPLLGLMLAAGAAYGYWTWEQKDAGQPPAVPGFLKQPESKFESDAQILFPALQPQAQSKEAGKPELPTGKDETLNPDAAPKSKITVRDVPPAPPAKATEDKAKPGPVKPAGKPQGGPTALAANAAPAAPAPVPSLKAPEPVPQIRTVEAGPVPQKAAKPKSSLRQVSRPVQSSSAGLRNRDTAGGSASSNTAKKASKVRKPVSRYTYSKPAPKPPAKARRSYQVAALDKSTSTRLNSAGSGGSGNTVASLRQEIKSNPNSLGSQRNLTLSYMQQGNYQAALKQARAILKSNPNDSEAQNTIALIRVLAAREARKN